MNRKTALGQRGQPGQRQRVDDKPQSGGRRAQSQRKARTHGARMGDNGDTLAGVGGDQIGQGRVAARAKTRETFAAGGRVPGQIGGAERAQIGQIAKGHPVPRAEILFPQRRLRGGGRARPQGGCGLGAAARGAGDDPVGGAHGGAQGGNARRIAAIGLYIRAAAQTPAVQRGRMPDQHQFCRCIARHGRIPSFTICLFLLCHRAMSKTILITGGARSGKSVIAEQQAKALGPRLIYIATAEVRDGEMAARVAQHQARRGNEWTTRAEPIDLPGALSETDGQGPRLVDCLTLWLTNLMLADRDWQAAAEQLTRTLGQQRDPVVIVTNEVGAGIVPENALARAFRDAAGQVNQQVAAVSDEVYMAVAGIPLKVKPHD